MKQKLWFGEQSRYFLIDGEMELPHGSFLIQTIEGEQKTVAENALAIFEVPESEAKAHFKENILQAIEKAQILLESTIPETVLSEQGETSKDIQKRLSTILIGLLNEDPSQLNAAREHLRNLQKIIEANGLETGINLANFPEQLEEWHALSYNEESINEWGNQLIEAASIPDDPSLSAGQRIDKAIKELEKRFDDLLAYTSKEYRRKQRQKSYRQAANLDIATALKAHGITPIASSKNLSSDTDQQDDEK